MSMHARFIRFIKPFIQRTFQISAWDVEYNSFIIVCFIEPIMRTFYNLLQFHAHFTITDDTEKQLKGYFYATNLQH